MKRNSVEHFSALAAGIVIAIALVSTLAVKLSEAAHDPAEHVREVLVQSTTAFERADMAALEKTWANDASVTVFESGHANYGWADYRDNHLGPEMKGMKNTKYTLSDIKIKVSGDTAWATFKYTISAEVGARHVDGAGLGTAVTSKSREEWKKLH